jgi:hypothetical protein
VAISAFCTLKYLIFFFLLFISIHISYRKERNGRNPLTGEKIKIPGTHVIVFHPSPVWEKAVIEEGRAKAPPKRPLTAGALKLKELAEQRKKEKAASSPTST